MIRSLTRLGLALAIGGAACAQTLLIPAAANGADLPSSSGWPFDYGSAMRILYVYDSSHFTGAGVTSPILINRIRIRANGANATWTGDTVANLTVDLSTAPLDYAVIDATYDNNHGVDRAQVYNSSLAIAGGTSTAGAPGPFHIDIPITPFLYDPAAGDLTIDFVSSGVPNIANTPTLDTSSTTGQALARRVYGLSYSGSATGTIWSGESAHAVEFTYTPPSGIFAAFTATPLSGPSPLLVQFSDASFTSDPGGITAWAWDFDNDGNVDSTLQNPSHSFGCGDFTVKLTVTAANGTDDEVKPNYVSTDNITAGFTFSLLTPPNIYQFTDTTTPAATAWSWDLDGDGNPDSTVQNPTWAYPLGCSVVNVTLDATRLCRTDRATAQLMISPARLDANLTGGTGTLSSTDVGNFFDVSVTAADGVSVCALNSLTYTGVGPYTVSVYVTDGSYVGKDTNAAAWRLIATGNAVMGGGSTTSPSVNLVTLNAPFYLPAGNYGMAIYHRAASGSAYIGYTNASNGPFANADLSIHPDPVNAPGISRQALFGGGTFGPRQWNGTFFYSRCSLGNDPGYGFFAPGCAGSLAVATNTASALPRLNNTLTVAVDNLPVNAAIFVLGFSRTASVFGPLPLPLAGFGAPGCSGLVSTDATTLILGAGGTANFNLALPNIASLLCMRFYTQALVLDPGSNGLGAVVSDGAAGVIGQ